MNHLKFRKAWELVVLMLFVVSANASTTILSFDLSEFLANPTTNRQVVLQSMSPFPGNMVYIYSDTNGMAYLTNPVATLYNGYIAAPPAKTTFQLWVTSTNLGLVDAYSLLATGSASTYPAGQVAWSISTSDARYQLSGSASSNAFYPLSNPSNYATLTQVTNIASRANTNVYVPGALMSAATNGSTITFNAAQQTNASFASTNYVNTATNNLLATITNIAAGQVGSANFQPSSANLSNYATLPTNSFASQAALSSSSNVLQIQINGNVTFAQATNISAGQAQLATNAIGLGSGFSAFVNTNQFVARSAGAASNLAVTILKVYTNLSFANLTNIIGSTNIVGVMNAGSSAANGTYIWNSTYGVYSNADTTATINYQAPTWFISMGAQNLYSSITGPNGSSWTVVNGSAPAPSGDYGIYLRHAGIVDLDVITSSNLTAQIIAATNSLASTNYVNAATNNLLSTVTNIASQFAGTASNAIANLNGYGTNTFLTNATINGNSPPQNNKSTGTAAWSEGMNTLASGNQGSHAGGFSSTASGLSAFAQGFGVTASGAASVALGNANTASGNTSIALGVSAYASADNTFEWSGFPSIGDTNTVARSFRANAPGGFVLLASTNGVAINTNSAGTNGLRVAGNVDSSVGFTVNGVPMALAVNAQPANSNLTNYALLPTNSFIPSALSVTFQPANANLTNYALLPTNSFIPSALSVTFQPASANLTNFATLPTNSFVPSVALVTLQPANANLTNFSLLGTNAFYDSANRSNFITKAESTNLIVAATNNLLPTVTNAINANIFSQVVMTNTITTNGYTISLQTGSGDMIFTRKGSAGNDLDIGNNYITTGTNNATVAIAGKLQSTNVFAMGGLTNLARTTNIVGVVGGGSAAANGTYVWNGSVYSNATTTATINFQNPTWFITTNGVNLYSSSSPNGPWAIVNGSSPIPTGDYGVYFKQEGIVYTGVINSTNLTYQITNAIATSDFGVSTKLGTNGATSWNQTLVNPNLGSAAATMRALPQPIIHKYVKRPILQYSSWWDFGGVCPGTNMTQAYVQSVVDAWATNGLRAAFAPYQQPVIWLDSGWGQSVRDANGGLQPTTNFTSMTNLVLYAHTNGFRFGLYDSLGSDGCEASGTTNQTQMDGIAMAFANWGVDAIKVDSPPDAINEVSFARMYADAFTRAAGSFHTPKEIILFTGYEYSAAWPWENPQLASLCNIVESSAGNPADISGLISRAFDVATYRQYNQEPGFSYKLISFTSDQGTNYEKAALGLSAVMSSTIQISEKNPSSDHLSYYTNPGMLEINQDLYWRIPTWNWYAASNCVAVIKPLGPKDPAEAFGVFLGNVGTTNYTFTLYATNFGLPAGTQLVVKDCWGKAYLDYFGDPITNTVAATNSALLKVYVVQPKKIRSSDWQIALNGTLATGNALTPANYRNFISWANTSPYLEASADRSGGTNTIIRTILEGGTSAHSFGMNISFISFDPVAGTRTAVSSISGWGTTLGIGPNVRFFNGSWSTTLNDHRQFEFSPSTSTNATTIYLNDFEYVNLP